MVVTIAGEMAWFTFVKLHIVRTQHSLNRLCQESVFPGRCIIRLPLVFLVVGLGEVFNVVPEALES